MKKAFLAFLLLMIPFPCFASILSGDVKDELIDDFSGGMYTNIAPNKLNKTFSPFISNFYIDKVKGMLVNVEGYSVLGATSTLSKINFFFKFVREGQQDEFLVSDSSMVLSTKDFGSYTIVATTLNTVSLLSAAQIDDKVWFTNGSDSVFTWDGTTIVVLNGFNGTPSVPKGKYIVNFQDLPFLANSTYSASALHYASDSSTDGAAIAPDDRRAWPAVNQLNVSEGDGLPITSLWIYDGLFVGKERSISKIFQKDVDSFVAIKTKSEAGPISNDAVVIGDNLTYFKGRYGIYKFNGSESAPITNHIQDEMDAVQGNAASIVTTVWDTADEFGEGRIAGTTFTAIGLVMVTSPVVNSFTGGVYHQFRFNEIVGSTTTPHIAVDGQVLKDSLSYEADLLKIRLVYSYLNTANCSSDTDGSIDVTNNRSGISSTTYFNVPLSPANGDIIINYAEGDLNLTRNDVFLGSFTYKLAARTNGEACILSISSMGTIGSADVLLRNRAAQYVSDIATVTTITAWDKFDGVDNNNGGNISYFIRAATSVTNIVNTAWRPISRGAVIDADETGTRVQWCSTMTSNSISQAPEVDYITIGHNEGGLTDTRPLAAFWENRVWLAASTVTTGNRSVVYLKSKETNENPNAFIRRDGLSVKALFNGGDVFYAGSSTAGVILRLVNGRTDNGSAIASVYEIPGLALGNYFYIKDIIKYLFEVESKLSSTLTVKTATDGGSYSDNSLSLSSGRNWKEINKLSTKSGRSLKLRLEHNTASNELRIGSLAILYKETQRFRETE